MTVNTVMERSKVPLTKWLLAAQLMASSKKGRANTRNIGCVTLAILGAAGGMMPTDCGPPSESLIHGPKRLWSLWEMLDFKAAPFFEATTALARAKLGCSNAKKSDQRETADGGVELYQIDPVFRRMWSDDLEKVVRAASDLEISSTGKAARRLLSSLLNKDAIVFHAEVERELDNIETRLFDDLEDVLLLRVEARHKDSYRNPQPFGLAVNDAFPSAHDDISEAMTCHALERSTAAVMHAMRALEAPMGALAKVFGVPIDKGNWQNWIDQIESEIRKISNATHGAAWKDEEKFYSEAARHFFYLKNAWRNHAMHAKDKYTEAQADEILRHVASFMKHLATRLKE